ncbi:hypothetical protein ABT369_35265 [Dactylosporangium sp. NPDC000244]|uniref:hypothetical protein n=1 Tax=Dactylosporangium sp. NPDC000244 TaxID=3154365 RepID=UPI00331F5F81
MRMVARVVGFGLVAALAVSLAPAGHEYSVLDVGAGVVLAVLAWLALRPRRRRPRRGRGYAGWDGLDLHKTDNAA